MLCGGHFMYLLAGANTLCTGLVGMCVCLGSAGCFLNMACRLHGCERSSTPTCRTQGFVAQPQLVVQCTLHFRSDTLCTMHGRISRIRWAILYIMGVEHLQLIFPALP
jgi:hypothetical protein